MKACMLVRTEPDREQSLVKRLNDTEEVQGAWMTFGQADVVVMARVEDLRALDAFVRRVQGLKGVLSLETMPQMDLGVA